MGLMARLAVMITAMRTIAETVFGLAAVFVLVGVSDCPVYELVVFEIAVISCVRS